MFLRIYINISLMYNVNNVLFFFNTNIFCFNTDNCVVHDSNYLYILF